MELAEKKIQLSDQSYTVHSLRQLIDVVEDDIPFELQQEALFQIVKGLGYLHSKSIIHGDLKSANVLIKGQTDDEFMFKLCDFGQTHSQITLTGKILQYSYIIIPKRTLLFILVFVPTGTMAAGRSCRKLGTVSFEAPEVFSERGTIKILDNEVV